MRFNCTYQVKCKHMLQSIIINKTLLSILFKHQSFQVNQLPLSWWSAVLFPQFAINHRSAIRQQVTGTIVFMSPDYHIVCKFITPFIADCFIFLEFNEATLPSPRSLFIWFWQMIFLLLCFFPSSRRYKLLYTNGSMIESQTKDIIQEI